MPVSLSTKTLRDGVGGGFPQQVLDRSGAGTGPFLPTMVLMSADGGTPVDIGDLLESILEGQTDSATVQGQAAGNNLLADIRTAIGGLLTGVALAASSAVIGKVGLQVAGADVAPANALPMIDAPFMPLGHRAVTVTAAAQTLSALLTAAASAIPAGTKLIYLQPRGDGIRYAHGGSTPTTASDATGIGTALYEGAQYPLRMADFSTLKLIAPSNTVLSVEFRG